MFILFCFCQLCYPRQTLFPLVILRNRYFFAAFMRSATNAARFILILYIKRNPLELSGFHIRVIFRFNRDSNPGPPNWERRVNMYLAGGFRSQIRSL